MKKCIICGKTLEHEIACKVCGFPSEYPRFLDQKNYQAWISGKVTPYRIQWSTREVLEKLQNELKLTQKETEAAKQEIQHLKDRVQNLETLLRQSDIVEGVQSKSPSLDAAPERSLSMQDMIAETEWSMVFASIHDGTYRQKFKLGDIRWLDLGGEGKIAMQIVAFDRDILADGSGKAAITWIGKQLLRTSCSMNTSNTASGGWKGSKLRAYLHETILPRIPHEIQKKIKPVKKYTSMFDGMRMIEQETVDSLWIPGYREVCDAAFSEEPNSVTYTDTLFSKSRCRIRKQVDSVGASRWWLRRAFSNDIFCTIQSDGNSNYGNAYASYGIALGFCL